MGARRTARERALQALYELDVQSQIAAADALEQAWVASDDEGPRDESAHTFALELVQGVRKELEVLDGLIESHSTNWRIDRMSRIDRNVLRLGVYELKYRPDIPRKVTLNEAVELGKKFGSEDSSSFINGLLDKVAQALGKP
jgi:transcription antitermination protein NusB